MVLAKLIVKNVVGTGTCGAALDKYIAYANGTQTSYCNFCGQLKNNTAWYYKLVCKEGHDFYKPNGQHCSQTCAYRNGGETATMSWAQKCSEKGCSSCNGTGKIEDSTCDGKGVVPKPNECEHRIRIRY